MQFDTQRIQVPKLFRHSLSVGRTLPPTLPLAPTAGRRCGKDRAGCWHRSFVLPGRTPANTRSIWSAGHGYAEGVRRPVARSRPAALPWFRRIAHGRRRLACAHWNSDDGSSQHEGLPSCGRPNRRELRGDRVLPLPNTRSLRFPPFPADRILAASAGSRSYSSRPSDRYICRARQRATRTFARRESGLAAAHVGRVQPSIGST